MRSWHGNLSPFGSWHTGGGFSPLSLFALSQPGVWYDPSDLTTLFQDTAGTQPVTTAGQTVALALDKSKGLVLGPELVTNGTFDTDTGWNKGTGWTISGGTANTVQPNNLQNLAQPGTFPVATYRVRFTVSNYVAGALSARFTGGGADSTPSVSANGTYTFLVTTTGPRTQFDILASGGSGATATIDNISVRELPGNHATQSILASRPTYGVVPATGRRNLLTFTEQFDNAAWSLDNSGAANPVITANAGVAPNGTQTADRIQLNKTGGLFSRVQQILSGLPSNTYTFSVWLRNNAAGTVNVGIRIDTVGVNCAVTPTWQRFSVTLSAAGTIATGQILLFDSIVGNDETADILAWGAQVELGSTATAYQRVVSAFDVTEAGVQSLSYLSFDGIDDFLVTPTITPNTDKVQVFAGVRKLSDAAQGIIVELTTSAGVNAGSFNLQGPGVSPAQYRAVSGGSGIGAGNASVSAGYAAPVSNVFSVQSDISGDSLNVRLNGVLASTSAGDQGTGNYSAAPIYIGRRGGTSLPFNGNLYGLVVRFGPNLDAATINQMETWMNGKTEAY